jgi:hypothetical protein
MRRLPIILALLLGGCAGTGAEPEADAEPVATGSIAPAAHAAFVPSTHLRPEQQRAIDKTRKPLQAFLAEKGSNCGSPKLREASARATDVATAMASAMRPEYEALLAAGSVALDVADAARSRGCHAQAKRLYEFVLKNYSGLGYAALRDRASAGAKALRGAGLAHDSLTG